ncbi:hypothetical protein [Roseibium litorale]|uniref:Uncharacterized protein n=1 Tax=Roseibium litorale TaxID=2803841 RepID=A0ABR9CR28_9HYPH|nr:hypothetical protein [Roseibium litorale]MBD8892855.1 hypothetical protein [Roseibium litorale]
MKITYKPLITLRPWMLCLGLAIAGAGNALQAATPSVAGRVTPSGIDHADAGALKSPQAATVTAKSTKGDAQISLSGVKPRQIRCVSGADMTSCTGWPVATLVASN